jgi:hypothetical protein
VKSANTTRYKQESSIQNRASLGLVSRVLDPLCSIFVENPLQIGPFLYKRTQSCPPPADSKPFISQRFTKIKATLRPMKTNPNEPKRTQNEPNFWPVRAPQSQNEPKRTQSKPNFSLVRGSQSQNEPKQTQFQTPHVLIDGLALKNPSNLPILANLAPHMRPDSSSPVARTHVPAKG